MLPDGLNWLCYFAGSSRSHRENSISFIFLESPHQVDMKNVFKCYKHFFGYFNALKPNCELYRTVVLELLNLMIFFISILAVSNPSEETVVNISNLMDDTRRRRSLISERPLTSTSAIVRSYSSSSFESPDEEDNSSDDWGDSDSERRREIS